MIRDVELCAATNGLIVSYCEYSNGSNPYDGMSERKKEVFKLSEKQKAIDCFIDYATKAGLIEDEEEKTEET